MFVLTTDCARGGHLLAATHENECPLADGRLAKRPGKEPQCEHSIHSLHSRKRTTGRRHRAAKHLPTAKRATFTGWRKENEPPTVPGGEGTNVPQHHPATSPRHCPGSWLPGLSAPALRTQAASGAPRDSITPRRARRGPRRSSLQAHPAGPNAQPPSRHMRKSNCRLQRFLSPPRPRLRSGSIEKPSLAQQPPY